jgi:hypothetical protein
MSVIINDFEVVVEPPAQQQAPAEPSAPPPSLPMSPIDLEDILRRQAAREARVRAH